ncbi:MAG: PilZ domain-containing protein [Nannocystaceae bacterium]|nr:PilZ domain-containing protein [Nannocystaceae bacterium]
MTAPSQPTSDRRTSARVPHRVRAVLATRLGEVTADVIDISEGGLGIEITGELRAHDFVRVLLPLAPDDESSDWVDPDALVAQVQDKTGSGRTRVGLSFFRLPPAILRRIAACIANRPKTPSAVRPPTAESERPTPAATVPPPASTAATRELPKAASIPAPARNTAPPPDDDALKATPIPFPKPAPVTSPASTSTPLHIPRTSARELRALFHEAVASLEVDNGDKQKNKTSK